MRLAKFGFTSAELPTPAIIHYWDGDGEIIKAFVVITAATRAEISFKTFGLPPMRFNPDRASYWSRVIPQDALITARRPDDNEVADEALSDE